LAKYSGIKQNYCEFGNLDEDIDYEVRVYSKNDAGSSEEWASKTIHTQNKPPLAPFGLGVTYAKNNRIDLIWDSSRDEDIKGFIIQIKSGKGSYQYYSKNGITSDRNKAFVVNYQGEGLINYSIAEKLEDGTPIIENAIPYSLRVLSVDKKGAISRPSTAVIAIIAEDTIPPNPPYDIKYEFEDTNRLTIKWKSDDRDVEKFILFYGVNKGRWDGVVSTENKYYELVINSERLKDNELYISIKAVDRSGNESGYKPFTRKTSVSKRESVTENIVLPSNNIYKDYSVAVKGLEIPVKKQVVKKRVPSTPVQKRAYGYQELRKNGFVVKKGETATITGKQTVPEGTRIQVKSGGTLIIQDAELKTNEGEWEGIQYDKGAGGDIRNTVITKAVVGVTTLDNDRIIKLRNVKIVGCTKAGIEVKNSRAEITLSMFIENSLGIHVDNGKVDISNSIFENNEKGILSKNYSLSIIDSQFNSNRVYGVRLYGGGSITNCSFRKNLAGIVLEPGTGSVTVSKNVVELNHMDGVVVNTSNSVISRNSISNNGRHGIYIKENANPDIFENDIVNNQEYAIIGGGKITRCYVAYNNGSAYIDDTPEKGRPDNVLSSSSSGIVKQILNVDYINYLAYTSVLK
jgi:parallel beta-helix repeat protein